MIKIPEGYTSNTNPIQTNLFIKQVKDFFQIELAKALNLTRVSAPLMVYSDTGLNDNLSGNETPIKFEVKAANRQAEIIHSLAKWKRTKLNEYGFAIHQGLYTDMNAIRKEEDFDNIHSIYVDQWDWEKIIDKEERNIDTLKQTVNDIYSVFKKTEVFVKNNCFDIELILPEQIFFITSQELENLYPDLDGKQRENAICKEKKAVFIIGIGNKLKSGKPHDSRAPDYDDWNLNGDLLFYNPILDEAIELSSMGIRVDDEALIEQLNLANCNERINYPYHQAIINNELPFTIGGGIGQSRICLYFLRKAHIGEVQATVWDETTIKICKEKKIYLL